jgi:hypothetical protein
MNSDREEMLVLLHGEYPDGKQQSAIPDLWDLEATSSMKVNPKTGQPGLSYFWQLETCSACGKLGCVLWSEITGYRCDDCRSRRPFPNPAAPN